MADPRRTNTSRIADMHIAFRPGTDLALMHSMAWVIIHEELDNARFWQRYVNFMGPDGKPADFDAYRAFLEDYRPERAAKLCNIPEEQIYEAARLFAESPATMSLWCMGINQRVQGVAANNLIHNLHLLTGQIGRPGATPSLSPASPMPAAAYATAACSRTCCRPDGLWPIRSTGRKWKNCGDCPKDASATSRDRIPWPCSRHWGAATSGA